MVNRFSFLPMVLLESGKTLLGTPAPEFSLPGTDGHVYTLSSFPEKKALVVVFMCNHCPYVVSVIERLNSLARDFFEKGAQFIGINPNDDSEYPEDSFENMKKSPVEFPYLRDESQEAARAFGAVCTPDIFVYDGERNLSYRGRIDDNWQDESRVQSHDLAEALEKIISGKTIPEAEQHPSMGCSIKWKP